MATRINKYLSEVGYCSRREADRLIVQGKVTINGKIPEIGTKVDEGDDVEVEGHRIDKSIRFLSNFIHPDLSFGGQYGSRNTNFIFPGGIEIFSKSNEHAKNFSNLIKQSIKAEKHSTLLSMDDNNLVPMFNSYCIALIN